MTTQAPLPELPDLPDYSGSDQKPWIPFLEYNGVIKLLELRPTFNQYRMFTGYVADVEIVESDTPVLKPGTTYALRFKVRPDPTKIDGDQNRASKFMCTLTGLQVGNAARQFLLSNGKDVALLDLKARMSRTPKIALDDKDQPIKNPDLSQKFYYNDNFYSVT